MTCNNCGAPSGGGKFCLSCGSPVARIEENNNQSGQIPNQSGQPTNNGWGADNQNTWGVPSQNQNDPWGNPSQGNQQNQWGTPNQGNQQSQWGTGQNSGTPRQRRGAGAGLVLGIVAITLTVVAWATQIYIVELIFSIPAIILAMVGSIIGGVQIKKKGPVGLILSLAAFVFALVTTILFMVWTAQHFY
ncbi:MAG: hypothetical protein FWC11_02020 [Firmicutes bacterium]|nr:hypothetical protein [Bacillota bacterium]